MIPRHRGLHELTAAAVAAGAQHTWTEYGGRHRVVLAVQVGGRVLRLPVANSTGRGRSRHLLNAVAQVRRMVRQAQQ